jgi:hypothetical protein
MRPKRISVAVTVAALLVFGLSACTKPSPPAPTPPPAPTASPTPEPDDLLVQGVSVTSAWELIKKEFGITGSIEIVPRGENSRPCIDGQVLQGSNPNTDAVFVCDDGRLAVASALADKLRGEDAVVVWYYLGFKVAQSQLAYNELIGKIICAGSFIAARSPSFGLREERALAAYVVRTQGEVGRAFMTSALQAAAVPGNRVTVCRGA